ncbi:hypothetical protein SAMN04487781_3192 [Cellulosimicrobium cellulans]|nr:hypothetical protein SAMN04487781_3192 [Cellulosimicrobium cellulans]
MSAPALARAAEKFRAHRLAVPEMVCEACGFVVPTTADGEHDHAAWFQHRIAATVAAALHDRDALRDALRTADDDYQAREHEANVGRGPEPGDWWLFMVNAMADQVLGQSDPSTPALLGGA